MEQLNKKFIGMGKWTRDPLNLNTDYFLPNPTYDY